MSWEIRADPEEEEEVRNFYGYNPNRTYTLLIIALFMISSVVHAFQAGRYKTWYPIPTIILCSAFEIIGWGARLISSFDTSKQTPFIIQAVATLVGPTPLLAADFIIVGNLIRILGPKYSRLRPKLYSIIFLTCDIIALIVQTVGGGMASAFLENEKITDLGAKLALYGVIFQFIAINGFLYLTIEFLIMYKRDKAFKRKRAPKEDNYVRGTMSNKRLAMVVVLFFNMVCLYIRSVYRVAELSEGFHGTIVRTQTYFTVFDGQMLVLAIWSLNLGHPGLLLAEDLGSEQDKPWNLGDPVEGFRLVNNDEFSL